MLSLLDLTPEELRTVADFWEDPFGTAPRLSKLGIVPVVEVGDAKDVIGKSPTDVLVGFERTECDHALAD